MVPGSSRIRRAATATALAFFFAVASAWAQDADQARTNPLQGNPTALKQGQNIYRGRCAVCHGIDAKGYRGSDLTTGDWVHGGTDAQIFKTIRTGVPGTEMPGHGNMSDDEIWMVVTYLRTLSAPGGPGTRARRCRTRRAAVLGQGARQLRAVPHGRRARRADRAQPHADWRRAFGRAPSSARFGSRPK